VPELPEVEILVRHLAPLLENQRIRGVAVLRPQIVHPDSVGAFGRGLEGARFVGLDRRGKYLRFRLRGAPGQPPFALLGHLGMTGRMYLQKLETPLPRHVAVTFDLGKRRFVFEDTRYFGCLTRDTTPLTRLGPEPLTSDFTVGGLATALKRSAQPVKVKLLDQSVLAGVGNIYASEALFRAGVSPRLAARRLTRDQVARLHGAIRDVLEEAIRFGSTVPLDWTGRGRGDRLFYYGRAPGTPDCYEERLAVYDRAGEPCRTCGVAIRRLVQAARSTFYCPRCQRG
jgi:formamidopyrimidine-DNA glycosylase